MPRICPKCFSPVPSFVVIDGKKRNCQRRKYCFDCSPFGEHNTARLEKPLSAVCKVCPICSRHHTQGTRICFCCYFNKQKQRRLCQVEKFVGGFKCWCCGYDKCKRNIHFHHINEKDKLFGLTTRELMLKWDRVISEIEKCVIVCGNCHGEIHEGLKTKDEIDDLWSRQWLVIRSRNSIG